MSEALPWSVPRIAYEGSGFESRTPQAEARLLLSNARKSANLLKQKLLASAREEAQFLREQAREQGFSEGYSSGLAEGLGEAQQQKAEEVSKLQAEVQDFLAEQSQMMECLLGQVTENLAEIALRICESMLGKVPERTLPMDKIKEALESLSDGGEISVRVHPDDTSDWATHHELKLIADETLEPGDFSLSGGAGMVDGCWETRWQRAKGILEEY